MVELKHVQISVENKIATLKMNHPPANALSEAVMNDLDAAIGAVASDHEVKVIVITAEGRFFVAGADINMLDKITDAGEGAALAANGQRVFNKIERLTKPVICAVNGIALGGGCELAMACLMRIAAEDAKFGQPEISLGLIPGYGGTQRLMRIVGPSKACELVLTGDMIDAGQALAIGLVNAVVPTDKLSETVRELAEKIASKSMPAITASLGAIEGGMDMSLVEGLDLEAKLFGELCETADKAEGTRAFLEKRKPNFQDK
jgi:enoyl-CoA hydratase/carnithine racemase